MGFWDTVGSLAKGALNQVNEYNAEIQALKTRMEEKSSDELRRIVKSDGGFLVLLKKSEKWLTTF